jgi:hypothetical protein
MVTGNYKWKCTFTSCGATNEISRQKILDKIANGKKVALIYADCGYISLGDGPITPGEFR